METKKFYYWLDSLRAIAALLVLLVHSRSVMFTLYVDLEPSSQNIFTQLFYAIANLGGFAVCMFYILSGFLVGGKTIERISKSTIKPKRFFLDRLFRIGVPLTGALALIVIVNLITDTDISIIQLIGQYTGLQGIVFKDYGGVFWTLPYEIWFYAILLSILCLMGRRHKTLGIILFILSIIVFSYLTSYFLYVLSFGILAFYIKDYKINRARLHLIWFCAAIAFIFYFVSTVNGVNQHISLISDWSKYIAVSQLILFAFIAVLVSQYAMKTPTGKVELIINKYGKMIATFSYSLFLTHYQILKLWMHFSTRMNEINLKTMSLFIAYNCVCILAAYVFYYVFERNTVKIQKKIESLFKICD